MPYEVPAGWAWVRMGDITDIVSGVAKGRNLSRHKTIVLPYLRVANVQRGYLDLETIKEIVAKEEELERYRLQEGDLLLTEGGDADKLGRSAIWRGEIADCIHQNHIFRARPYGEELHAEWLQLCTNSQYGRNYFFGASKQTTNLASINMRQLRYFPIALPPQREQQHIIGKLLEMYTLCDQIIGQTTAAEQARERLLAAVLAGARNGVP